MANIKYKTFREIHIAIISSNSVQEAANKLEVDSMTLRKHLAGMCYGETLTFLNIKFNWTTEESALAYWGETIYDQPIEPGVFDLEQKATKAFDRMTLSSDSIEPANKKRGRCDEETHKNSKLCVFVPKESEHESGKTNSESLVQETISALDQITLSSDSKEPTSEERERCAEETLKNNKLCFFVPKKSEHESEEINSESKVMYNK